MAGLAGGLVAGLAQGFAGGMRLRSEMEDAEKKREAMGLQMENQKLQNAQLQEQRNASAALSELEKGWATGETYRPEGAGADYDHRTDPAAVSRYYENLRGALRRQAAAFGRSTVEADKAVDGLVKEKYQEKVGQAISLMKSNPNAAIPAIRSVYAGFRDGNEMTDGTYDKETDSFIFKGKDKDGKEIVLPPVARKDAIEGLSYGALNGADAAKLLIKSFETDKAIKAERENLEAGIRSREKVAKEQNESQERIGAARNATTLQATGIEAGARVQAAGLTVGSREDERNMRELQFALGTVNNVFAPEIQAIKDDPRGAYKPEEKSKQIADLQVRQGWTEEVVRLNHRIGNGDNISARAIAAMSGDAFSGRIAPRITGPYMDPKTNQPNLDYAVVDGKFIIPTPKGVTFNKKQ